MKALLVKTLAPATALMFSSSALAVIVVSNISEPRAGVQVITGIPISPAYTSAATSFTVGGAAATLNAISLYMDNQGPSPDANLRVQVFTDAAGAPGADLTGFLAGSTFVGPPGGVSPGTQTFATSLPVTASTQYWLVVSAVPLYNSFNLQVTASDAQTSAFGWLIGNNTLTGGPVGNLATSVKFSLDATPAVVVPEPTTVFFGALLLVPFAASSLRHLRKSKA